MSFSRNDAVKPGPEQIAELERRLAAVESGLRELAKRASTGPDNDGWRRMGPYARSRSISTRTVDRRVAAGLLEKKKEGNCAYVREVVRRRRGRSVPVSGDDAVPMSATPGGPIWPYPR